MPFSGETRVHLLSQEEQLDRNKQLYCKKFIKPNITNVLDETNPNTDDLAFPGALPSVGAKTVMRVMVEERSRGH